MKHPKEMTDAELCALTEQEKREAVRRACAEAGVPLLDFEDDEPPTPVVAEGDVKLYVVGEWSFCKQEDADAVARLVGLSPQWEMKVRWDLKDPLRTIVIGKRSETPTVNVSTALSDKRADQYAAQIERFAEDTKAYKSRSESRGKHLRERADIEHEVLQMISAAKLREARRESYATAIRDYVSLADGDFVVARRFFEKAYPSVLEEFPDLATLLAPAHVGVDLSNKFCGCVDVQGKALLREDCPACFEIAPPASTEEIPF